MFKKKITYKILQVLLVAILIAVFVWGAINFENNRLYNLFQLAIILFLVLMPLVNFIILIIKEANFLTYDMNKHFFYSSMAILVYSAFFSIFLARVVGDDSDSMLTMIHYDDFSTVFSIFLFLLVTGCVGCVLSTKKAAIRATEKEKEIQERLRKK